MGGQEVKQHMKKGKEGVTIYKKYRELDSGGVCDPWQVKIPSSHLTL